MIVHSIQNKYIKERGAFEADSLSFGNIFGAADFRKVIPLGNPALLNITDLLSSGKTKSGSKYKVNIEDSTATKEGDKRLYNAGRVIGKELGKEYLDEWSRQADRKDFGSGLSIIISRHPIDIMRMSDHDGIRSCHSPNREYFQCAIEESKNGGAVAYIVSSSDLENIDLQAQDIFEDNDRDIRGIVPFSRMRLNKYSSTESEFGEEILVPVNKSYGRGISGFYESVKNWAKGNQPRLTVNTIDEHFNNLARYGGSYSDYNDGDIFNEFFDTENFKGNAIYEGEVEGSHLVDIWNEEIQGFWEEETNSLEHTHVWAEAVISDNIVYISSAFNLEFSFEDFDSVVFNKTSHHDKLKVFDKILDELGSINEIEDVSNGIIRVDFDRNPENPDELRDEIRQFAWFEKSKYKEAKAGIYDWLVGIGAIEETELHEKITEKRLEFANMRIYSDGEGVYEVSFEIAIPKIPDELLLVQGVKDDIKTELQKKIWDKLSKAYYVYTSQLSFIEGEDLSISVQFPQLDILVYNSNKTDILISWIFEVHEFTVRNQKVLMNFFKFLDKNFASLSDSIYKEMTVAIDEILKVIKGPYYGKNWYDRSRVMEERIKADQADRQQALDDKGTVIPVN